MICPLGKGAGGADFFDRLRAGGHAWNLTTVTVPMGGPNAAAAIAAAITKSARECFDAVVVCRGGGSPVDLEAFNAESVARAIVEASIPIVVAVGHATDTHIADLVAHTTLPTPSAAAAWLNDRRKAQSERDRRAVLAAEQERARLALKAAARDKQAAEVAAVVAQRHTRRALVTFVAALVVIIACVLIVALTLW